jgi:hypothetical protein
MSRFHAGHQQRKACLAPSSRRPTVLPGITRSVRTVLLALASVASALGLSNDTAQAHGGGSGAEEAVAACAVKELKKSAVQGFSVYSPDGTRYLINKRDDKSIAQLYIGKTGIADLTCLTCVARPGGPAVDRFKWQPHWSVSGKWIFLAAERA